MSATYGRRCGRCRQVHLCQQRIRDCFCVWCGHGDSLETIAVTPEPPDADAPSWIARLWQEVRR